VKVSPPGNEKWMEQYRKLRSFWNVTPYLEKLLGEEYTSLMSL